MHHTDPAKVNLGKALGRIPSGVFILTATAPDGSPHAMMASWVQQASFDPPSVSIAIAKGRPIAQVIKESKHLALAVVPENDTTLMKRYARGMKAGEDPFAGIETITLANQIRAPKGALAYLSGKWIDTCDFGADHELLIAEIIDGSLDHPGSAFMHQRGSGFHY